MIPQNEAPKYVSTDTKVDAKAAVANNPSVKRLDQAGKIVYYYGDSPLTGTLDGLKNANHIDKNFAIATSINTQIEQLGNLQMDARLGNDRVNVLATNNSNYYSVNMSNGSPSDIRKEVPLYGVEIDFNRDDKNIYQGNYQVEGTGSNKHPYNVYNADTNELVGTINGTRFNIPKSVSRIRIAPKDPVTVGYGPNATIKNVIFNVFFNGTDETAETWKKNMDAGQVTSETTRFDAKLLNQDLTVAAQKNHTLTITNEFIGTRLTDDSYVFFTPTTTTNYVTMPLLVTNSLRGKLPTSAISKIEIKDKYGIIGRNFNNNFRASDEFQPISLFIDNAGTKVTDAHRANTGNFVDTVYNGGASNNTYIGLTAQLPAGTHIYDIPVRLTTFDGVSVVEKDGSTSTSNVTEATLRIVTYDSKTTGTSSFISSGENSGTNIKIPNVDNGLVATTYVNNFTESDVNQLTAMSYIPKAGIEGSTANTTLKSAVTAPAGWKVMYTTDAISGNYKTDRNLSFTDSVSDYSKVTALKFVSTNAVKASTATPFEVPLNFEGTVGNDKVNYRSVLLTDDKELLSTPVTAKPATGNIVYEYRMLFGKNLIKSENSGDKFTERTENYTFGETITDAQGRKYHRAKDGDANTVSTVVKEGTTTITRYYIADNVTTITVKYELDMTDEATKLASEGKIGMPEFANGVLANVNNPLSDLRLEDSQLFVGDRVIQAGDRWGFSPNHYKTFEETPDIDYTGKNVVLEYTRLSATASPDLKDLFDNYVKTGALVDMADDGTPMMMVNVEGTNAENSHATITYYYKIRSGSITQHFVDEQGNKLADDTTTGKLVADASVVNVSYPSVITKDGATYNYVRNNQTGTLTPSTFYVDESGNNVKIPDEGLHEGPKVIGDKWQYVKTIPEKDGILTHVYTTITSEIPGDAPQTDKPELEVTRYVSDKGEELKETEEGTKDAPKVLKDKWQYDHTEPKKDGITTHVYVEIQHEIPNDAPKIDIPEAKATVYVDENGNNVKTPDEGLHDGPKVIDDKWQYVKTIPEKDGILIHVYTQITSEIPNDAPQTDKPEAKATVYINEQGETVKTPDEGLHDGPKVIDDKWEYVRTIPEKDGILTHVYTEIKHEIPNNPPIVDIPEAKATRYVNTDGVDIKTPDEGLHDGPKVINDKWQYVKTIPEKDGILTHVYTVVKYNIPNNPPIVEIPEAKATVYINEQGETVKTPDEGLHDGPKVIDDKWEYVKTIPEKDGILTHVYTEITHNIPNNPPIVEIPELEITRYIDEHGKDIKDPEPGTKEAPKTIGKYEFSRTIPKKDGVTTHVYKEIPKETPNKPTPNTDKRIPNKPVDKTPKVEQPVNETVVKTQETVNNTAQNVPAKTNELPHTGDNDSSKALAVSGLAMFMAGIIGVFRKKKQ